MSSQSFRIFPGGGGFARLVHMHAGPTPTHTHPHPHPLAYTHAYNVMNTSFQNNQNDLFFTHSRVTLLRELQDLNAVTIEEEVATDDYFVSDAPGSLNFQASSWSKTLDIYIYIFIYIYANIHSFIHTYIHELRWVGDKLMSALSHRVSSCSSSAIMQTCSWQTRTILCVGAQL